MGPPRTVDLNADVGEADDESGRRVELDLLGVVTTVHVACGGHAGDDESMRSIMAAAHPLGVGVGAHPSYPDRPGFGRRPMEMEPADLLSTLRAQIGACAAVARACGVTLTSVKAHGALYAAVAQGGPACAALLGAVGETCAPGTAVVLPAGAPARQAVSNAGFPVLEEGFCDRAYTADGGLLSRQRPGSVYDDPDTAAAQALGLAGRDTVVADDGTRLTLRVDTLCLHGDSPGALAMAVAVRQALTHAGIGVAAAVPGA
jgi:5-oxoprolinase (ATP-hydrolysing) subunit A